jgi:hypothetical protein
MARGESAKNVQQTFFDRLRVAKMHNHSKQTGDNETAGKWAWRKKIFAMPLPYYSE